MYLGYFQDKIWGLDEWERQFESHAAPIFNFPTRKYSSILFKFLDFLWSLDRFKFL